MKKWLITVGVIVLCSLLYIATLVYTVFHSKQGNFALSVLDLVAIFVAYQVLVRLCEVHQHITEDQRGRLTLKTAIALLVSAVVHLFGTFMPTPELQLLLAFALPVGVPSVLFIRLLMQGSKENKRYQI